MRAVKQFLTFAGGTPLQHAAAAALSLPDDVVERARARAARASVTASPAGCATRASTVLACAGTYFLNADGARIGEDDATALCAATPARGRRRRDPDGRVRGRSTRTDRAR